MSRLALIVGNTHYDDLTTLSCCTDDVKAIHDLLKSTGEYESIDVIENKKSEDLKETLRNIVKPKGGYEEIFFYFTGHGYQNEEDFYFCATDFRSNRPNETGLSNGELHSIFQAAEADLIVKIVDACNSGTKLIKDSSYGIFLPKEKEGINNYIQIASCLGDQNSLTGDPLSMFTEKFVDATLRKEKGLVLYSDILNVLRDEFLENSSQTPHFVHQGTGREKFIEDAAVLEEFRKTFYRDDKTETEIETSTELENLTLVDRLKRIEEKFCTQETSNEFIENLFSGVVGKINNAPSIEECFLIDTDEHQSLSNEGIKPFIVRVLSKEKRPDDFVTAEIETRSTRRTPFSAMQAAMQTSLGLFGDQEINENYELSLNCTLDKVQLTIVLTPRFRCLRKFKLVISCAPSVEHCYVFERCTLHKLSNWGSYSSEGDELTRRWYKKGWLDDLEGLTEKISNQLISHVQDHVSESTGISEKDDANS